MIAAAAADLADHIDNDERIVDLLAACRANILARCTEPGNAPVGAPYPYRGEQHGSAVHDPSH